MLKASATRSGGQKLLRKRPRLQGRGKVQTSYVADRLADVRLQYSGDLPAKRRIIKNKRTDVVFSVILHDQVALVRAGAIPVNVAEDAQFASHELIVFLFTLCPYRRPIGHAMAAHEWMISKLHTITPLMKPLRLRREL
jgi:hypothetical protein